MKQHDLNHYHTTYSDQSFWAKVSSALARAGESLIVTGLTLYHCLQDANTPAWAKAVIVGALGYLISPIDAVPDFIPGIGYTDDVGVIAGAIAMVAAHITPAMRAQAQTSFDQLIGRKPRGDRGL